MSRFEKLENTHTHTHTHTHTQAQGIELKFCNYVVITEQNAFCTADRAFLVLDQDPSPDIKDVTKAYRYACLNFLSPSPDCMCT